MNECTNEIIQRRQVQGFTEICPLSTEASRQAKHVLTVGRTHDLKTQRLSPPTVSGGSEKHSYNTILRIQCIYTLTVPTSRQSRSQQKQNPLQRTISKATHYYRRQMHAKRFSKYTADISVHITTSKRRHAVNHTVKVEID